jgi:hypothetical protein
MNAVSPNGNRYGMLGPVAHDKGLPYPAARHSLGAVVAVGRIGVGLGALAAPRLLLSTWIGAEPAAGPPQQVLARALGGRDVALGVLALQAISGGSRRAPARTAVALGAFADGVDMVATVRGWSSLPRGRRWLTLGLALGATAAGVLAVLD